MQNRHFVHPPTLFRAHAHTTEVAAKFFSACNHGDVDTIKQLLKTEQYARKLVELTNSEEPNAKKIAEKTIYTATLRGHYEATKVLLEAGANARVNTGYGTPIYAAVKSGSLDLVRLLIEYRADFQSGKGFSPLFVACIEGRLNILKYLVDLGANLYAFTNPPLVFTACTAGQLEVLKFLMDEMEFNIRHTMSRQDYQRTEGDGKDTLLWCACKGNKLEVASYLVKRGAPITRTIYAKFPVIIKHILQQKIRPVGRSAGGEVEQHYHARFKEIGLAEIPWAVLADYSKRLTKLELRANTLTSIPDKIFQMEALKVLDVSNNALAELCQEEVKWNCLQ